MRQLFANVNTQPSRAALAQLALVHLAAGSLLTFVVWEYWGRLELAMNLGAATLTLTIACLIYGPGRLVFIAYAGLLALLCAPFRAGGQEPPPQS